MDNMNYLEKTHIDKIQKVYHDYVEMDRFSKVITNQEIIDNGYSKELAKQISDDLATKGGYLFNKSHSYSYAVLCLQTAYLKSHFGKYFLSSPR